MIEIGATAVTEAHNATQLNTAQHKPRTTIKNYNHNYEHHKIQNAQKA